VLGPRVETEWSATRHLSGMALEWSERETSG
jgi:hypothetical protein